LWRVEDPDYPEVAAANGQFMSFWADDYRRIGGHSAVRNRIVEDLALAKVAKQYCLQLLPRFAVDSIHCRMYRSGREVLDGFSKNAYEALGERPSQAIGYSLLITATQIAPPVSLLVSLFR